MNDTLTDQVWKRCWLSLLTPLVEKKCLKLEPDLNYGIWASNIHSYGLHYYA